MMKRLFLIVLLTGCGVFAFGQPSSEMDTAYLVKKAKKSILKFNKRIFKNPPELRINWDDYQILGGTSTDCSDRSFEFLLVSFSDFEGHYAQVIMEYVKKRKLVFLECKFTLNNPEKILDDIEKDPKYYWGCDVLNF